MSEPICIQLCHSKVPLLLERPDCEVWAKKKKNLLVLCIVKAEKELPLKDKKSTDTLANVHLFRLYCKFTAAG